MGIIPRGQSAGAAPGPTCLKGRSQIQNIPVGTKSFIANVVFGTELPCGEFSFPHVIADVEMPDFGAFPDPECYAISHHLVDVTTLGFRIVISSSPTDLPAKDLPGALVVHWQACCADFDNQIAVDTVCSIV